MQLEAFALVLAFQASRSGAKLVPEGHLETEHMREITRMTSQLCSDLAQPLKANAEPPQGSPCQTSRRCYFSIGDPGPVLLKTTCSEPNDVKSCGESDLGCRFERMVIFFVIPKSRSGLQVSENLTVFDICIDKKKL